MNEQINERINEHCSLFGPFLRNEENEVLWTWHLVFPTNIRLGWMCPILKNTLAYYSIKWMAKNEWPQNEWMTTK